MLAPQGDAAVKVVQQALREIEWNTATQLCCCLLRQRHVVANRVLLLTLPKPTEKLTITTFGYLLFLSSSPSPHLQMLTKIITTAIAVVVLAAPTSAFYEACFYSDNECTTKVDCLTADEYAEAVTDDPSDDDYGPNNMTSCDDYFDMYNAQDHDHDFTMNVTVFESCRKNVSPCSLQCKGTALSTACIADCDTKCAECSTSKEASQEETCKSYHCPSTIPGTTTKYLSSQSDCLKTTTMKTTTALATLGLDGIPGSASGVTAGALFAVLSAVAVFV